MIILKGLIVSPIIAAAVVLLGVTIVFAAPVV